MANSTETEKGNSQDVRMEIDEGIATITIDRPAARNALSLRANELFAEYWEQVQSSDDIRSVVLTSADCGTFCAGMDLKEAAAIKRDTGKDILSVLDDPFYQAMRNVTKPIIAAMTGHFTAGGMLLCLNSDIRVGLAGTKGGITEAKVGRGSPWAAPLLWMLPEPIVSELILTGETMPVEKFERFGFINYVESSPEKVRAKAQAIAQGIVANAPLSVTAGKQSIRATMTLGAKAGFEEAKKLHEIVYSSQDAIEGPRAFAEKRSPVWTGC